MIVIMLLPPLAPLLKVKDEGVPQLMYEEVNFRELFVLPFLPTSYSANDLMVGKQAKAISRQVQNRKIYRWMIIMKIVNLTCSQRHVSYYKTRNCEIIVSVHCTFWWTLTNCLPKGQEPSILFPSDYMAIPLPPRQTRTFSVVNLTGTSILCWFSFSWL